MLASTGWPDRQPVSKHGPGLLPQWQPHLATTFSAGEDRIPTAIPNVPATERAVSPQGASATQTASQNRSPLWPLAS